jgi:uncharacterized membrane protein YkvA (DUF1232 family)
VRLPNKSAPANHRPAGQSDGSGELGRDGCRQSASPAAVAELAALNKLKNIILRFKRGLQLYRNILADPRTPKLTKWLLGSAVAYAVTPFDLIPDFIPVIGHLDDAIILPLLVYFALRAIPKPLLEEHRRALSLSVPPVRLSIR